MDNQWSILTLCFLFSSLQNNLLNVKLIIGGNYNFRFVLFAFESKTETLKFETFYKLSYNENLIMIKLRNEK